MAILEFVIAAWAIASVMAWIDVFGIGDNK